MKTSRVYGCLLRTRVAALCAAFLFLSIISPNAAAQKAATIRGCVVDQNGSNIADARVLLTTQTNTQFSTFTNQAGEYEFKNLRPGLYLIEVRAEGFAASVSSEIDLQPGGERQLNTILQIAAINAGVVVSATGTLQKSGDTAKVVTTLDAPTIEAKHSLNLAETLRGVPGLRVQQQGSPGALTTLRLRGLRNFDTAILLDGLRVRDAGDINGSAVSLITDIVPVSLDRIEVLRGSGSSIYGTHAIGGVINLIPEIVGAGTHYSLGFEGGSLATFRERVQVAGGGNRFGYNLGINRLDVRRGIDSNDQYGNSALASRLQFHPTESITVSGSLYETLSNARVNDSPLALSNAFLGTEQYPRAIEDVTFHPDFNNPDQGRRNRLIVGSGKLTQVLGSRVSYSIAYQRVSSNRRNYNGPLVDPAYVQFVPFGDFEFLNINRGIVDLIDSRITIQASRSNLITSGFEFENESFFQSSNPSFAFFNNTTDRQRSYAMFAQDQISLLSDRLQLSLGVRGQSYRIRPADRPGLLEGRNAEGSATGDGSIAYFIRATGTKLRAHAGNGFRAPSLFERFGEGNFGSAGTVRFGDPTLRAEQSISVDGGIDQRLASDRLVLGATYFYTKLQRVIAFTGFVTDPLGLGRFSGYVNRSGGLSRGLETYAEASFIKGMNVRASYTFTNSDRFVPSIGLQPEYVIPKHLFGLTWTQRYRSVLLNFDFNHTGAYISPVFENDFPFRMAELRFGGYTKGDLFVSYERRRHERLSLVFFGGLENVFHQRYFENGFLAPGTIARGGVNVKF